MKTCPSHEEYTVPMIQTMSFPGAELWCPYCGYTAGAPFGNVNETKETPELEDRGIKYFQFTTIFLHAMGTRSASKTLWNEEMISPADLPMQEKKRLNNVCNTWRYGTKAEDIKEGDVFGSDIKPPDPLFCRKCGKKVESDDGVAYIGMQFQISISDSEDTSAIDMAKKQWGKYFDDALKPGGISICFECWIDTMLGTE